MENKNLKRITKITYPAFALLALACFALSPSAQAVVPAPDGGYPGFNTAEGDYALSSLTTGYGNTANGCQALFRNATGSDNTATGAFALEANTTGNANTAVGGGLSYGPAGALMNNTTGSRNTAIGYQALLRNQTGFGNTAEGFQALANNTGSFNIAVGYTAGVNLTTGHDNIDIGTSGAAGESNTIRIGTGHQTATFIGGIRGITTGNADAVPVLIDSAGQLGTAGSSRRFKHEIKPMDKTSEAIFTLKPVTFQYKSDRTATPQFGLIAEEVAAVNPNLVVRDENGEIYTVRYDAVNAMLLNEFLKEHRKVEQLEGTIASLAATVKEQAAQIQKVSAQLEATKPAPQVVNNP